MPDLTAAQAAAELNTTPETVRRMIATGALGAYRLTGEAGPWRIRPDDLDSYRERQRARDPWVRTRRRR